MHTAPVVPIGPYRLTAKSHREAGLIDKTAAEKHRQIRLLNETV